MSWKNAFAYMKRIGQSHGVGRADKRADDGLPFGARVGSLIKIPVAPFMRAQASGSLVKVPKNLQETIKGISHLKIEFPGDVFRYYLSAGDEEGERFLQVVTDPDGQVLEVLYGQRILHFAPQTAEDQDVFTGEKGYGLGEKVYSLEPDQLAEAGFSESDINQALAGAAGVDYLREVQDDADFIPPFHGTEVRIDDSAGDHGSKQQVWFMPYARDVSADTREFLLISTELLESRDGVAQREIYVDMVLGVQLDAELVSVQ